MGNLPKAMSQKKTTLLLQKPLLTNSSSANYGSLVANLVSLLYRSKVAVDKKNVGYPTSLRGAGDWLIYVLWWSPKAFTQISSE